MSLRARIRSLFRMFLLFTVLVAIAMISAITTIRVTIQGHQEAMPKLTGMQIGTAQRIAVGRGLELKVEDKLFSTQYPVNEIVSQVPPPGTRIKVGQRVHVIVSLGPPRESVPNLVGGSLRAARITAIQRGLSLGDVALVHWPGGAADQVIVQDPPPTRAEVHSPVVNLLVSRGDSPSGFLCPNFVGRPLPGARRALEKAGFKVASINPIPSDTAAKGSIVSQSPAPGSKIGPDAAFDFQVAQ